jgi:hypothetical protein
MSETRKCSNPACGKIYTVDKNGVDDGFCQFECWETVNISAADPKDTFEDVDSVKELFSYKM